MIAIVVYNYMYFMQSCLVKSGFLICIKNKGHSTDISSYCPTDISQPTLSGLSYWEIKSLADTSLTLFTDVLL